MTARDAPELTTERLRLRALYEEDAPDLLALYSDPTVMRHWSHAPWCKAAQALAAIDESHHERASGRALHLAICLRGQQRLAGSCALFDIVPEHRRATIGYLLAQRYWGQGLGAEALKALINHGFRDLALARIEAEVDPANHASQSLLMRLGFRCEGRLHARWRVAGQARDVDLWALLGRDWPG